MTVSETARKNHDELHPYFTQPAVQKADAEHGILTQAWSPIGGITFYRGTGKSTLQDPASITLENFGRPIPEA
jgi:diketogulonate reductase-like aldo/keto reductase